MIALVDYGAGNLTSVRKAFAALGAELFTPAHPHELASVAGIVVPGVGHFDATRSLANGWREATLERVHAGVPLLGICLGLQWLFDGSTEAPGIAGLGLFPGMCRRLDEARDFGPANQLKIPHVGWNSLTIRDCGLMKNVPQDSQVYFTHSYAAPVVSETVATTDYGIPFSAAVERDNIAAMQFHPEKSGDVGLTILRNWLNAF